MKTITLEEDISLEQFVMVVKLLDAINIKVKIPKKIENLFKNDLDGKEKQEFIEVPDNIQSIEDFEKWLAEITIS